MMGKFSCNYRELNMHYVTTTEIWEAKVLYSLVK